MQSRARHSLASTSIQRVSFKCYVIHVVARTLKNLFRRFRTRTRGHPKLPLTSGKCFANLGFRRGSRVNESLKLEVSHKKPIEAAAIESRTIAALSLRYHAARVVISRALDKPCSESTHETSGFRKADRLHIRFILPLLLRRARSPSLATLTLLCNLS